MKICGNRGCRRREVEVRQRFGVNLRVDSLERERRKSDWGFAGCRFEREMGLTAEAMISWVVEEGLVVA